MTLWELPARRAERDPASVCIADETRSLTNLEFGRAVRTAAGTLAAHGVTAGDTVAVVLPNRLELVVALFAAWHLGAAVTPVNPALTETETAYQVTDSGARVVVGDPAVTPATTLAVDVLLTPREYAAVGDVPAAAGDQLALVIYTSGTTGRPKGVMLTHDNLAAMASMVVETLDLDDTDRSLLVLPLFHVNGIVVSVLSPLLSGGSAVVAGRFRAETFFAAVERVRPTYFSAVPAIYVMLTNLPADVVPDTSSLRRAICGAAPMPADAIAAFEARYGVPVVEGYGLSEGTCASTINPPHGLRKPGTVGLPMVGQQVALHHEDGTIDRRGTGEVVIKGPNVMLGYLGRPEETARTIVDGWLHTGDVGRFDEDGYLVLVDRIKDLIIRGGENLYPKEIENTLYSHPAVVEAAVVGAPDPVLGEVPVAFVSLRPGSEVTVPDLVAHCGKTLARIKVPARIEVLETLPKNPVGKIDKPQLRTRSA